MALDLSAAGHLGRELEMMLAGAKPLALFYDDADDPAGAIPEERFAPHVAQGTLVRGDLVLELEDPLLGSRGRVRYVLYAVPAEAWRIPAALLAIRTRLQVNALADEGLERLLCALLGYTDEETAACMELQVLERC
jgi:hypothetical protein